MNQITKLYFSHDFPRIAILNNSCFYQDFNEFGNIINELKVPIKFFEKRFEIRSIPNYLIHIYFDKSNFLFNSKLLLFESFHLLSKYRIADPSNCDFFRLANKDKPETILFDNVKKSILWSKEKYFSFTIFNSNYLINYDAEKKEVIRYDFNFGDPLWQYTLPEKEFDWHVWEPFGGPPIRKAEVRKMLGVHQNILWVVLNSGFLLGIDAEKGVLVHTINMINSYVSTAPIYPQQPDEPQENWGGYFTKYLQLDEQRGVVFGLKDSYYIEIDLSDPLNTYTVYDVSETMQVNQIEADMATTEWAWQGDEIFFGKNFSGGNNLGVFNRATKQVSWATRVLNEKGSVESFNKIEYASGRLYALTQKTNTLYVFEKDHS